MGATPNAAPKLVQFKGYALDAAGIPEFETAVDGVSVRERLEVRDGKLVRRFRVMGATTTWFAVPEGAGGLAVAGGTRDGVFYRLNGAAAQEFTVTHAVPAVAAAPTAPVAPGPAAAPTAPR